MTKHEIDSIKVGTLVKYKSNTSEDMGLLSKILDRPASEKHAAHRLYVFTWSNMQPSTETASSLNGACFTLVQNADA